MSWASSPEAPNKSKQSTCMPRGWAAYTSNRLCCPFQPDQAGNSTGCALLSVTEQQHLQQSRLGASITVTTHHMHVTWKKSTYQTTCQSQAQQADKQQAQPTRISLSVQSAGVCNTPSKGLLLVMTQILCTLRSVHLPVHNVPVHLPLCNSSPRQGCSTLKRSWKPG
jgi:hypothetical protein